MGAMGLIRTWEWVNRYGKKQGRVLVQRIRAALRDAAKNGAGGGKRCSFRYDPLSYALNFDDGGGVRAGEGRNASAVVSVNGGEGKTGVWVYVLWVRVE